jgi:hypothetical protein
MDATRLGFKTPDDLRHDYPAFYWNVVDRYIQGGLRYLRVTQEGSEWVTHLYAHTFAVEHHQRLQAGNADQVSEIPRKSPGNPQEMPRKCLGNPQVFSSRD